MLIITGIVAKVFMEQTGSVETFEFGSDYTVKDCLAFIEHCDCKGGRYIDSNLPKRELDNIIIHDLFVVYTSKDPSALVASDNATKMENDKLLSSYKLKLNVCIDFGNVFIGYLMNF